MEGEVMGYKYILYEEKERIGIMTLNRPDKRNAMGKEFELEIASCLREARDKRNARVIIVKAVGPVFCSGHDKAEILHQPINDVRAFFQTCIDLFDLMRSIPSTPSGQTDWEAMSSLA